MNRPLSPQHEALAVLDGLYRLVETPEPMVRWVLQNFTLDGAHDSFEPITGEEAFYTWVDHCIHTAPDGYLVERVVNGIEMRAPGGRRYSFSWSPWVWRFFKRHYRNREELLDEFENYLDSILIDAAFDDAGPTQVAAGNPWKVVR